MCPVEKETAVLAVCLLFFYAFSNYAEIVQIVGAILAGL